MSPPRAGGGLPHRRFPTAANAASSPRRRGSSVRHDAGSVEDGVLPAQAGVFRPPPVSGPPTLGPPRAGGGLPPDVLLCQELDEVLPAQAGVFPVTYPLRSVAPRPPRAGGGLPSTLLGVGGTGSSSPRRLGSSAVAAARFAAVAVLPAQAGVFLGRLPGVPVARRPPRAGGGLPPDLTLHDLRRTSSPRRRGSSEAAPPARVVGIVLPAQAGVFPTSTSRPTGPGGPPRAGGGLPDSSRSTAVSSLSSPRRRGSSSRRPQRP